MYVESGWNLNNLPVLPSSVLQFISADISGMKVKLFYVCKFVDAVKMYGYLLIKIMIYYVLEHEQSS